MEVAGFEIPSESPVFLAVLAIHVPIGLLAVVAGAAAMLAEKRRGWYTKIGSIYFWSITVLFGISTALARCVGRTITIFSRLGRWLLSPR